MNLEYLDFDLLINSDGEHGYEIVVRSPAGEAREFRKLPFDRETLKDRQNNLQLALLRSGGRYRLATSPKGQPIQQFGLELFNALFTGSVLARYEVSQQLAADRGKGLRIKLNIRQPSLSALPWEFLYDPRSAEYLCLSSNTPVIRYLELQYSIKPLVVEPPLQILGMTASPSDLETLDAEREKRHVEEAVRDLGDSVKLTWLEGQTWQDLQQKLQVGSWHIFHFIGHGGFDDQSDEGFIALADETGKARYLKATELGRLLADHNALRLVVLNSCDSALSGQLDIFSSTASILIRRNIPAVLAMQYEITDRAAIEFSRSFYRAIANDIPIDGAVAEARKAISLAIKDTVEWGTPVLYLRSQDGRIFDVRQEDAKPPTPPVSTPVPPVAILPEAETTENTDQLKQRRRLAALYARARKYFDSEDWAKALEYFQRLQAMDAGYKDVAERVDLLRNLIANQIAALKTEARTASDRGDWATAVEKLKAWQALNPGDRKATESLTYALAQQAQTSRGGPEKLFRDAKLALEKGETSAALEKLKETIAARPDHAEARNELARVEREMKLAEQYRLGMLSARKLRWRSAASLFKEVVSSQSDYRDAALRLKKLERRLGILRALKNYALLMVALAAIVVCVMGLLRFKRAEAGAWDAVWVSASLIFLWGLLFYLNYSARKFRLVRSYDGSKRIRFATLIGMILLPLVTYGAYSYGLQSRLYIAGQSYQTGLEHMKRSEQDEAIISFDNAIRLNPEHAEAYARRGLAHESKNELEQAIADFDQSIKIADFENSINPGLQCVFAWRGRVYLKKSNYSRAFDDFNQAIGNECDSEWVYRLRGDSYRGMNKNEAAINDYTKAIQLSEGKDTVAYFNRAGVYLRQGKYDQTIEDYKTVLSSELDNPAAYLFRGLAYQRKGSLQEAINDYTEAIKWKGNLKRAIRVYSVDVRGGEIYAMPYYYRGYAYALKENYDLALADYDQALKIKNDYPEVYNYRGEALMAKKDYNGAIENYTQAINLRGNYAVAYKNRGLVHKQKGERQQAIDDLNKAIELTDAEKTRQEAVNALKELGVK
ncbi:MAG TPA: tetratricopeptide repeat protein [Pyrinomonadaceae bacterium]|nr:tetratricopeptide repeat protein [Pyrinomonadaceae bacterium]